MKTQMFSSSLFCSLVCCLVFSTAQAQNVKRDIPYVQQGHERQVLDIYAPEKAKGLPVVFWIHGGGWQAGDKSSVQSKPQAFVDRGFVFVSTNYRLLPSVEMESIVGDVAKSIHWVHDHIAEYGGDPNRLFIMGHSAGAQLAALMCTDDRYLKNEQVPFSHLKGCVPVDGDTYDIPAMITLAEIRCSLHGQPLPTFGHRAKFGNDLRKHRDFSPITHVAKDKGIPPFLILHVSNHPDTSAQANWFHSVLTGSGVQSKLFAAKDSEHSKLNDNLGTPNDPASAALFEFVAECLKR